MLAAAPFGTPFGGVSRARESVKTTSRVYEESSEYFPNPERGWHVSIDPAYWDNTTMKHEPGEPWLADQELTAAKLREHRLAGRTLIRKYYHLYPYRDREIPEEYLQEHPIFDLDLVREGGFKLIPRFIYTWTFSIDNGLEANLQRMLGHLDQLAPVLRENADVISHMEVGLIGTGGEWRDSGGGYLADSWQSPTTGGIYSSAMNERSRAVVDKVLEVLPDERMALLRGISYLQKYVYESSGGRDTSPISVQESYSATNKARLGLHDDSFMYDETHRGTYWPRSAPGGASIFAKERAYQHQTTRFAVMSGEPSAVNSRGYAFKSDPFVEMKRMHWVSMNLASPEAVRDGLYDFWRERGAYAEIESRFGYRFSLASANVQSEVKAGGTFEVSVVIKNSGFATPHNERLLEIVLRHESNGSEYFLPLADDPRAWDETAVVYALGRISPNMPAGTYDVFLSLPDPDLPGRPEYSIRLANEGIWEPFSGYNKLGLKVEVEEAPASGSQSDDADIPTFTRRTNPPEDNGETAITIVNDGLKANPAPTLEISSEENDVLVGFDDRSGSSGAPLTGSYGGIDWGDGAWMTASDAYGKYAFLGGGGSEAQATFRLPEGKVLKSFMLLKHARDASIDRITVRSGEQTYSWDNPAPWWAHHVLVEDWHNTDSREVAVSVESDGRRLSANLGIDNIVYGDPSIPQVVDFDGLSKGAVLSGSYGGIQWGDEGPWRVGELDGYGKFIYMDERLLPDENRLDNKAYFTLPDSMVLKSAEVRGRPDGADDPARRIMFTAIPPLGDNPDANEYDFEGLSRISSDGWQNISFAYAKPWGEVGVWVRSEGASGPGVGSVLLKSITYRREVRIAR